MKKNLPVILLKGIVLLPYNDIRLEFDNKLSKTIIDDAELFHDGEVLVVSQPSPIEEMPNIHDLPKIGVVGKISRKIELPNGKTRLVITGCDRCRILEYLKPTEDIMEAIVDIYEEDKIPSETADAT
jgi:ATP-dependent Lon protease